MAKCKVQSAKCKFCASVPFFASVPFYQQPTAKSGRADRRTGGQVKWQNEKW